MAKIGSWRFWLVIILAIVLGACAGRRERREQARLDKEARPGQAQAATPGAAPAAAAAPQMGALAPGEGQMVFMRTSILGAAITASLFDVTEPGEPKFIDHMLRGYKVVYPVKPGQYTIMVVSEAADFMQVTVLPGKTYYALVTPRPGLVRARFSFKPVRASELGGAELTTWERARLSRTTPTALDWAKQNASSVAGKRDSYWSEWTSKSAAERAEQTLNAEDGR